MIQPQEWSITQEFMKTSHKTSYQQTRVKTFGFAKYSNNKG